MQASTDPDTASPPPQPENMQAVPESPVAPPSPKSMAADTTEDEEEEEEEKGEAMDADQEEVKEEPEHTFQAPREPQGEVKDLRTFQELAAEDMAQVVPDIEFFERAARNIGEELLPADQRTPFANDLRTDYHDIYHRAHLFVLDKYLSTMIEMFNPKGNKEFNEKSSNDQTLNKARAKVKQEAQRLKKPIKDELKRLNQRQLKVQDRDKYPCFAPDSKQQRRAFYLQAWEVCRQFQDQVAADDLERQPDIRLNHLTFQALGDPGSPDERKRLPHFQSLDKRKTVVRNIIAQTLVELRHRAADPFASNDPDVEIKDDTKSVQELVAHFVERGENLFAAESKTKTASKGSIANRLARAMAKWEMGPTDANGPVRDIKAWAKEMTEHGQSLFGDGDLELVRGLSRLMNYYDNRLFTKEYFPWKTPQKGSNLHQAMVRILSWLVGVVGLITTPVAGENLSFWQMMNKARNLHHDMRPVQKRDGTVQKRKTKMSHATAEKFVHWATVAQNIAGALLLDPPPSMTEKAWQDSVDKEMKKVPGEITKRRQHVRQMMGKRRAAQDQKAAPVDVQTPASPAVPASEPPATPVPAPEDDVLPFEFAVMPTVGMLDPVSPSGLYPDPFDWPPDTAR
jgi:hypothetical protein